MHAEIDNTDRQFCMTVTVSVRCSNCFLSIELQTYPRINEFRNIGLMLIDQVIRFGGHFEWERATARSGSSADRIRLLKFCSSRILWNASKRFCKTMRIQGPNMFFLQQFRICSNMFRNSQSLSYTAMQHSDRAFARKSKAIDTISDGLSGVEFFFTCTFWRNCLLAVLGMTVFDGLIGNGA